VRHSGCYFHLKLLTGLEEMYHHDASPLQQLDPTAKLRPRWFSTELAGFADNSGLQADGLAV
jgi:hypothetical protein